METEYLWNVTILIKPSLTEAYKISSVFKDFQNVQRGPFIEYFGQIKYPFLYSEVRNDS